MSYVCCLVIRIGSESPACCSLTIGPGSVLHHLMWLDSRERRTYINPSTRIPGRFREHTWTFPIAKIPKHYISTAHIPTQRLFEHQTMTSSVPIPTRRSATAAAESSYSSPESSSSSNSSPISSSSLSVRTSSKGKQSVSSSPSERISPRRPSLLGMLIYICL